VDARIRSEIGKIWDEVLDCEYCLLEDARNSLGGKSCRLVEVGCGSLGLLGRKGNRLAELQANSLGIDIDREALATNSNVTYRVCGSCYSLPLQSSSVDLIVVRWVLEHLDTPERAMCEFARVLRKGGVLYIKTPNLWNYTMMLSRATPTVFHNFSRRLTGESENIPTFYRANTKGKLAELATSCGFAVRRWKTYSYSYMYYSFNKELFLVMRGLSKLADKFTDRMHQTLLCVMERT